MQIVNYSQLTCSLSKNSKVELLQKSLFFSKYQVSQYTIYKLKLLILPEVINFSIARKFNNSNFYTQHVYKTHNYPWFAF